jgi:MYXO-CTERM domain-containing protein
MAALEDDIVDMVALAMVHPSALKIAGKPFFAFYVDSALVSVDEWNTVLNNARTKSGQDFYAFGTTLNASFFGAFDALCPWVNLGMWENTSTIGDLHDRAVKWTETEHAQIKNALASNPGRVLIGGIAGGFDDYTQNWGACQERVIPRDPAVLTGQFDYLKSIRQEVDLRGLFFQTWDDWTEGSEFEPDVVEGTQKLVQTRQLIGDLFGEPADPAGDQALDDAWMSFGQARNCCFAGGACPPAGPVVDLTCPDGGAAGASQGGSGGSVATGGTGNTSADASTKDGGAPDASSGGAKSAGSSDDGGCGCRLTSRSSTRSWFALALLTLAFVRRKRA